MEEITPKEAFEQARHFANLAKLGAISYEKGKKLSIPYLEIVNIRGRMIARKYGKRYSPITFTVLLR